MPRRKGDIALDKRPGEKLRRTKQSLAAMYPWGVRLISHALNEELDKAQQGKAVETDDAWKVIYMVDGTPKQRQEVTGPEGGPVQVSFTLNIGPHPPETPDSTQEGKVSTQDKD